MNKQQADELRRMLADYRTAARDLERVMAEDRNRLEYCGERIRALEAELGEEGKGWDDGS